MLIPPTDIKYHDGKGDAGRQQAETCYVSASVAWCRSMWLKAKLETCRRESEADTEAHVVDAARPSIQALTETGLVTKRASGHCGDA
jgi:hypothetical protein